MTYASRENSIDSGAPIELYEWAMESLRWRYTSADAAQTHLGQTYEPEAISGSTISSSTEVEKASLTVIGPRNLSIADLFVAATPSSVVTLTVYRDHLGEGDWQTYWKGRVVNAAFRGDTLELTHESVFTSLARSGLRRRYQLGCPHVLYQGECGVLPASYLETYSVDTITGTTLTAPASGEHPTGYFSGGMIVYQDSATGATTRKFIKSSNSDGTIVLATFPFGLSAGQFADFYPGCDHTLATCESKFGNVVNYGGMPYIPKGENPFGNKRVV